MNPTSCGELSANLLQAQAYNVYCDESCHLEHDGQKTMGLGAVVCPTRYAPLVNHELSCERESAVDPHRERQEGDRVRRVPDGGGGRVTGNKSASARTAAHERRRM